MTRGIFKNPIERANKISRRTKGKRAGEGNSFYGKKHSVESIRKIKEARVKQTNVKAPSFLGRKHSQETKDKIKRANEGRLVSTETRNKISRALRGRLAWNTGKKFSEESKKKMSEAHKGQVISLEHRLKLSNALKGEKSYLWQGGKSFEKYTINWTKTLKRSIRERDSYICQLCNGQQEDRAFDVHHIDYDKTNCNPNNLITLCHTCHTKTNHNRDYWINYFINL